MVFFCSRLRGSLSLSVHISNFGWSKILRKILNNSRLQSQEDASYALVFPTLPYLKGGSQEGELVR